MKTAFLLYRRIDDVTTIISSYDEEDWAWEAAGQIAQSDPRCHNIDNRIRAIAAKSWKYITNAREDFVVVEIPHNIGVRQQE